MARGGGIVSKKNNNEEERYRITLKGLLSLHLPEKSASEVFNAIELTCRRNNWGIAINEYNQLAFVQLQKVEETE